MRKNNLESNIQSGIIDYLTILEKQNKIMFVRLNNIPPVQRLRNGSIAFRRLPKGCKHGLPDILVLKNGRAYFLEVKTNEGKQSESQKEFENLCNKNDVKYFVVRNILDVQKILN